METALIIVLVALIITGALGVWNTYRKTYDRELDRALMMMAALCVIVALVISIFMLLAQV